MVTLCSHLFFYFEDFEIDLDPRHLRTFVTAGKNLPPMPISQWLPLHLVRHA
jgi:hypothetical protein